MIWSTFKLCNFELKLSSVFSESLVCTTLEFPTHNIDFHLLTASVNAKYYYLYICVGNSMVSSAIWKKYVRVCLPKTIKIAEGRVLFEVFERLTSACFSKLHEKPCYYSLIIYMTKLCRIESYACDT